VSATPKTAVSATPSKAVSAVPAGFSAERLGLPREPAEISTYLTTSYKGVGKKTADSLLERFGPDLFRALQERPEEVKAVLDERRSAALLDQWKADYARRTQSSEASRPPIAAVPAGEAAEDQTGATPARSGGRGRRGGRGRGGSRKEPASIG
jgi:hypothetical protein